MPVIIDGDGNMTYFEKPRPQASSGAAQGQRVQQPVAETTAAPVKLTAPRLPFPPLKR